MSVSMVRCNSAAQSCSRAATVLTLIGMCVLSAPLQAHDARPVAVLIKEISNNIFEVRWQVPLSVAIENIPSVTLRSKKIGSCTPLGASRVVYDPGAAVQIQSWSCVAELQTIRLSYPLFNPSLASLIRLKRASGEVRSTVLDPDQTDWIIPARETVSRISGSYFKLGVYHILSGYDHLLFLLCLLIIAGNWRRTLATITGFTLAHSATLALSALGYLKVPVSAVEAAIALSILFVATEIARNNRSTLTWRYPIAVSSSFGLLHGLGFAAALSDTGLPQTEIPMALLFFNLGVEAGQLLAIGTILLLLKWAKWLQLAHLLPRLSKPLVYGVGAFAALLLWQRVALFWFQG